MKSLLEFLINNKSTGIIKVDEDFVDLGLSVLWGTRNIGANEPYEDGHYYQWGGLENMYKKTCTWKTYPFNNKKTQFDEIYFGWIKNDLYPFGKLSKEFDVAYKTFKGKVHMPTKKQIEELKYDTDFEVIGNYQNSGRNCWKFTNKNDENKFIIIPLSGWIQDSSKITRLNASFCIWSSTLRDYNGYAYNLTGDDSFLYITSDLINIGTTVRPVKDK